MEGGVRVGRRGRGGGEWSAVMGLRVEEATAGQ